MTGSTDHVLYAAIAFIGIHLLSSTPLRGLLVRRMGEQPYLGLFSLLSAVCLAWLIWAYSAAPFEEIWPQTVWARHLPIVVMPFALIFVVAGSTTGNPTAVGAGKLAKAQDPAPGFLKITRHPLFWGIALWGLSHLPANGDLASIYFFGALTLLALLGMPLVDRKKEEQLGADWGPFAMRTSIIPFLAAIQGRTKISWREIGWVRPAIGIGLYVVVLLTHQFLFGVSPWPA